MIQFQYLSHSLYWPILAYTHPIFHHLSPSPWQVPSFEETPELLLLGELRRQLFLLKRAVEAMGSSNSWDET